MGKDLVFRAIQARPIYRSVSPAAYLVFLVMCQTAYDTPQRNHPARLYYAGWEPLALALGYDLDADGKLPPTAERAVARRVEELCDAKLCIRGSLHGYGRASRRMYELSP